MKKMETRTIPAVPARTIPAQPERTETVEKQVCDVCNVYASYVLCQVCGRDVCNSCHRYPLINLDDRDGTWCPFCVRLWTRRYRTESDKLEVKHEKDEKQLRAKWKAESLAITEPAARRHSPEKLDKVVDVVRRA